MFARIADMKQVITAKLKLHTTSEQFQALRTTQLAYRDALNHVSQYAYAHGKSSNRVFLQDGTYDLVRTRFKLPSQMACSVPRQVGATYKTLWTKVKQNAAQRKAGMTKKRLALCVSKLPLYPPCRFDRCAQCDDANAPGPARLAQDGYLVSVP